MDKNTLGYWQRLQNLPAGDPGRPRPRICRLLNHAFEQWKGRSGWPDWDAFGHLRDHLDLDAEAFAELSVVERKAHAIAWTLSLIPRLPERSAAFSVHPDEVVVGRLPPYSVGQGKELMRYLTEDEALRFESGFFNEWSPFGHICPDYTRVVEVGLEALAAQCDAAAEAAVDPATASFQRAAAIALRGVLAFAEAYAERCEEMSAAWSAEAQRIDERMDHQVDDSFERVNPEQNALELARERAAGLRAAAARLRNVPARPARSLAEGCQAIHLVHTALHWTGDITSLGRLDQILHPLLQQDLAAGAFDLDDAQEIVDAWWIKLDEQVILDRRHAEDRFTDADGALLGTFGPSNFDQGALLNQWMQQVTLGGVVADDVEEPRDATNDLTRIMMAASRRMPLNSPTLDLRVHRQTSDETLRAAAQTVLSGGAHPILMNDDRIVPRLVEDGAGALSLAHARDYACDGCFETHVPGRTEFSFGFVPALDVLEKALNSGAGLSASGPIYLRGMKTSLRTPPAHQIPDWPAFVEILRKHIDLSCHRFLGSILRAYGSKAGVSPSPLLSSLIDGCLESGRDFADGGARYKMFAPLMTGISTAADSLFVIHELVFTQRAFRLDELVACLRSNWGARPFYVGRTLSKARIKEIHELVRAQPRFGTGVEAVDQHAWSLIGWFCDGIDRARAHPLHQEAFRALEQHYGLDAHPFRLLFTPGVGTFEQYVFGGTFAGASADGRRSGEPIASDLSPAPRLASDEGDLSDEADTPLLTALSSFAPEVIDRLTDGAPADFNIGEDFPEDELVEVFRAFARGEGGNMMTVTVANADTLAGLADEPREHELVRVRMGGWTEFAVALSPEHLEQHRARRIYAPHRSTAKETDR